MRLTPGELLRSPEKQPCFPLNHLLQSKRSLEPIRIPLASPRDQMWRRFSLAGLHQVQFLVQDVSGAQVSLSVP